MFMFCSNRPARSEPWTTASTKSVELSEHYAPEQINRDEDCTFVAQELLKMRTVMSGLAQERTMLGDNEPIVAGRWG
jgi:hypothetical protein